MGHKELIESLRHEGEMKTQKMRQETEAEIELMQSGRSTKIQQIKERFHEQYRALARKQSDDILDRAQSEARRLRLSAEQSLSHRLYTLSCSLLPQLRHNGHEKIFNDLAGELPQYAWTVIRVNPEDRELAGTVFPDADIISDGTISGGLVATSDNGKIQIDNTFEKRLERAWTFLLHEIMKDI